MSEVPYINSELTKVTTATSPTSLTARCWKFAAAMISGTSGIDVDQFRARDSALQSNVAGHTLLPVPRRRGAAKEPILIEDRMVDDSATVRREDQMDPAVARLKRAR